MLARCTKTCAAIVLLCACNLGAVEASAQTAKDDSLKVKACKLFAASEFDWLRQKVLECWFPPVGMAEAATLEVQVQFELDRSGKVRGKPQVVNSQEHPLFRVAAASAVRAVLHCQPYDRLPREKYECWRSIVAKF